MIANWPLGPASAGSVFLLLFSLCACTAFSGDIKESNELGEWVVAKPETLRFKKYLPDEYETVSGLEKVLSDKKKYYQECLEGRPRWVWGSVLGLDETTVEDCSSSSLQNSKSYYYGTGNDWTIEQSESRLELARRLWRNNPDISFVVKGVVWRGIRKEIGKSEEKISDWEYWCLNPSLSSGLREEWKKLLEKNFVSSADPGNPDTKMFARLHSRICSLAWRTPSQ